MKAEFDIYRRMTRVVSYPEHDNPDCVRHLCKQSPSEEAIKGKGLGYCPDCHQKVKTYVKDGKEYDLYH